MGVPERRERERSARAKAVLDAARTLVREQGLNGTTTRKIAKQCELSEGTLFSYYRSKDDIFVHLLLEGIEAMRVALVEIGYRREPYVRRLQRVWRLFADLQVTHPEYFQVFGYLAHPHSTASVPEKVKREIASRSGDNFRLFARILGTRNARPAADVLWGSFVGLTMLRDSRANLGATPHPNDRELRLALDLLLSGIARTR